MWHINVSSTQLPSTLIGWRSRYVRVENRKTSYCITARVLSLCSFPCQTTRLIQSINGQVYYPLVLISAITVPMQGLPNFVVYLLPKLRRVRKRDPGAGWVNWVARSLARDKSTGSAQVPNQRQQLQQQLFSRAPVPQQQQQQQQHTSVEGVLNPSCINDSRDDKDAWGEQGAGESGDSAIEVNDKPENSTVAATAKGDDLQQVHSQPS